MEMLFYLTYVTLFFAINRYSLVLIHSVWVLSYVLCKVCGFVHQIFLDQALVIMLVEGGVLQQDRTWENFTVQGLMLSIGMYVNSIHCARVSQAGENCPC